MEDPYLNSVLEAIASLADEGEGPHLITADELRAAGALDVPPAWRKSLGRGDERDLFSNLIEEDDPSPEQQQPANVQPDH